MRKGPRPLPVHVAMLGAVPALGILKTNADRVAIDPQAAIDPDQHERLVRMVEGIRRYQSHPYHAPLSGYPVIWSEGTVTMRFAAASPEKRRADLPAVVLTPSLINRSAILDLCPERSLLSFLRDQGHNVYLLDWGHICDDPAQQDIDGIVCERLVVALRHAADHNGGPVAALGYCMGGTLLVGAMSYLSGCGDLTSLLEGAVLLATPWDFHAGEMALAQRVRFWAPSAIPVIIERGRLSVDWLQSLFASLDPEMTVRKFAGFYATDPDSEEARLFVAVEDWLNDGVDLPAMVARQCIEQWFLQNVTARGLWSVRGRKVSPEGLDLPVLVIASRRDKLVDYESAASICALMPRASLHEPTTGHIGLIAGRSARKDVWEPVAAWLGGLRG